MNELKSLPPHLLNFYMAYYKNFNDEINNKLSLRLATKEAWEHNFSSHPLTEAEEKRMRKLIGLS